MKHSHVWLMNNDPEYREMIDFVKEHQPVDDMDDRMSKWAPFKNGGGDAPLTVALVFTKAISHDPETFSYSVRTQLGRTIAQQMSLGKYWKPENELRLDSTRL